MSDVELTEDDKALIKAYLVALYKNQAERWEITPQVAAVVEAMIRSSEECSKNMDLVPRPHGITKPGLKYIRKQLMGIAKRTAKRHVYEINKQYILCSRVIKLAYRTPLTMAVSGL